MKNPIIWAFITKDYDVSVSSHLILPMQTRNKLMYLDESTPIFDPKYIIKPVDELKLTVGFSKDSEGW